MGHNKSQYIFNKNFHNSKNYSSFQILRDFSKSNDSRNIKTRNKSLKDEEKSTGLKGFCYYSPFKSLIKGYSPNKMFGKVKSRNQNQSSSINNIKLLNSINILNSKSILNNLKMNINNTNLAKQELQTINNFESTLNSNIQKNLKLTNWNNNSIQSNKPMPINIKKIATKGISKISLKNLPKMNYKNSKNTENNNKSIFLTKNLNETENFIFESSNINQLKANNPPNICNANENGNGNKEKNNYICLNSNSNLIDNNKINLDKNNTSKSKKKQRKFTISFNS